MKYQVHNLALFTLLALFVQLAICHGYDDLNMTYNDFKIKFKKPAFAPDQQSQRQAIFYSNLNQLKESLDSGCTFCGVTIFYDQTQSEIKRTYFFKIEKKGLISDKNEYIKIQLSNIQTGNLAQLASTASNSNVINLEDSYPLTLSWVSKGMVTSVKNQGSCGTCWSFATVAAIESSMLIKGLSLKFIGYEPDLSEEFLLTCSTYGSCTGGYLEESIDLAWKLGVPYEVDVPYVGYKISQSICSNTQDNVRYTNSSTARNSFYNVNDTQIISLLQTGPIMLSVSAENWENYAGGIFSCVPNALINHAVLLVGYDELTWLIKNQWGTSWGQNGYIRVTRNTTTNCQIGSGVFQLWSPQLSISLLLTLSLLTFTL